MNKLITSCRSCGCTDLQTLFSLGDQFVSDFVTKDKIHSGKKCPIDLVWCKDCTLLQQRYTASQDFMYTRHYWYRSGVTQTMKDALRDVTSSIERLVDLKPGDLVLDIGSNDGTLLRSYTKPVFKVGVEPAKNLLEEGSEGLSLLVNNFWSAENYLNAVQTDVLSFFPFPISERADQGLAKVITACGMLYDLEDPNQFIGDVAKVLHLEGVFIAQLTCLSQTVTFNDVGNLCHEHIEFYTLKSMELLLNRHGLEVFDLEQNKVNGGSYRFYIRHKGASLGGQTGQHRVEKARIHEQTLGLYSSIALQQWWIRLTRNRDRCRDFLLKNPGSWVYGASTKGNVILQWLGVGSPGGPELVAAADRSPEKVGLYTVGTGIRITSEEEFRRVSPKHALVLPYSFLSEFLHRESEWRSQGGKFIVPLPELTIV